MKSGLALSASFLSLLSRSTSTSGGNPPNPLRGPLAAVAAYAEDLWGNAGGLSGALEPDYPGSADNINDFDNEVSCFVDLLKVLVEEALSGDGESENPLFAPIRSALYCAERISKSLGKLTEGWPISVETAA